MQGRIGETAQRIKAIAAQDVPWWVTSLVIHLVVLTILATVKFASTPEARPEITVDAEIIDLQEIERPITQRSVFPEIGADSSASQGTAISHAVSSAVATVPVMEVAKAETVEIDRQLHTGSLSDFDSFGTPNDMLSEVVLARPTDYASAIDTLSVDILDTLKNRDVLVMMLFDESLSLVEDRKIIAKQIERLVTDINEKLKSDSTVNISSRRKGRLRWSVASFGESSTLHIKEPTDNMQKVKAAIARIKPDETGIENCLGAIQFCLRAYNAIIKAKQMFLILITDEVGSDTSDNDKLEATIRMLKRFRVRFYVFGRESNFNEPVVPEWLRDENGEPVKIDKRTGEPMSQGWVERGSEVAEAEFFGLDWLFYTSRGIPSGFGNYVQSRMANETNGQYFILSEVPSRYDDVKMEQDYKPEWCSVKQYRRRREMSRLRKTLKEIFDAWNRNRPTHWLTQLNRLDAQLQEEDEKAVRCARLVDEAIAALKPLAKVKRRERNATRRWEAIYDLTVAELYKFRFLLRQYHYAAEHVMKYGWPRPKRGEKFNGYLVRHDWSKRPIPGGEKARREWQLAMNAFKYVMKEHNATPFALLADRESKALKPLVIVPGYYVEPLRPKL